MVGEGYDGLSEKEERKMADRSWKAEMEERLKRIHSPEIPMEGGRILHLPSRTILEPSEENSTDYEIWINLFHQEFRGYRGELSIKKDGSFDVRHLWRDEYERPVEIWNDTERVTRELFDAAGLEIIEYEQRFVSPLFGYAEKRATGRYKIKD